MSARGAFATVHLLTWFFLNRLYLGNPMDPPDLLSVELSASRPTQHLGRVKSKSPSIPWCSQFTGYLEEVTALSHPEPAVLLWGQLGQGSRWDSWIPGSGQAWSGRGEAAVSAEEGILGLVLQPQLPPPSFLASLASFRS